MDSQVEQIDCIKGQVWLRNAREKLGSVVTDRMQGDNLAIVLCGAFEDADEEIDDENGWTRSATDGCDETLDAIHAHYVAIFARRLASLALPKVESETIERCAKNRVEDELWLGTTGDERERLFAALHGLICLPKVEEIPAVMETVISILRPMEASR